MDQLASPAIVLQRRDYGDFDLIMTALTRDYGKCTLIAKAAKKSVKRFPGGTLDPFSALSIVFSQGRGKGLYILHEATLENPRGSIRADIVKTAYACYWAELIALWMESGTAHAPVYHLLDFVLEELDRRGTPAGLLNILFQMRFVGQEGFKPVLERCTCCQIDIDALAQQHFCIDLNQGGVVCRQCPTPARERLRLSKGTLKQLQWIAAQEFGVAKRLRFSPQAIAEATAFLESFVPYHIGKVPHSLPFLQKMRATQPIH